MSNALWIGRLQTRIGGLAGRAPFSLATPLLAPLAGRPHEPPRPAAVDDALAAYAWVAAQPDRVGADPARLAVGGDSAGGNLAAIVAQAARDDDTLTDPAFQLLIYPACDLSAKADS